VLVGNSGMRLRTCVWTWEVREKSWSSASENSSDTVGKLFGQ